MTADPAFARWRPHPWHGLSPGPDVPRVVHAYIEITPFDTVKYEVDKASGYLRVDRPQRGTALPPTLYGFVPRTLCAARVGRLMAGAARGDDDPLDVCVLSERPIARAEVLLSARVVGGLAMLDAGEADDKLVAVLHQDAMWGAVQDVAELPGILVERLRHYFSTYKLVPGASSPAEILGVYGKDHARTVVEAALADYVERFGDGQDLPPG